MKKIGFYILILSISIISCENDTDRIVSKQFLSGWTISEHTYDLDIMPEDLFFLNSEIGFLVGLNGEIHKTINSGKTWEKKNSGTTLHFQSVYFLNKTTGYVGGQAMGGCLDEDCDKGSVLLKTTDGGETWTKTF